MIEGKGGSSRASLVLHATSGPDGKLHLEVPVGSPNAEFEIEVVVRPKPGRAVLPPGYFDLIGSVDDDTLMVHPPPLLPPSVEIDVGGDPE
jgi:hypothetical protein